MSVYCVSTHLKIKAAKKMRFLIYSLLFFVPGGSLILAGNYLFAFCVPVVGLTIVVLFSLTRWVTLEPAFFSMLLLLFATHFVSYLFGIYRHTWSSHAKRAIYKSNIISIFSLILVNSIMFSV